MPCYFGTQVAAEIKIEQGKDPLPPFSTSPHLLTTEDSVNRGHPWIHIHIAMGFNCLAKIHLVNFIFVAQFWTFDFDHRNQNETRTSKCISEKNMIKRKRDVEYQECDCGYECGNMQTIFVRRNQCQTGHARSLGSCLADLTSKLIRIAGVPDLARTPFYSHQVHLSLVLQMLMHSPLVFDC